MTQPYIGEIRLFAGNFAPNGWALCDGQQLQISEYDALFSLIGTSYGGDGQSTFRLPDLRGRVPVHQGTGQPMASGGGVEEVTLTMQQIPRHGHALVVDGGPGTANGPGGHVIAQPPSMRTFVEETPASPMAAAMVVARGGSQPHTNLQPYLCVHYIISLFGEYPTQS